MLDIEGCIRAEEFVVRIAATLELIVILQMDWSPMDAFKLFEHILGYKAITLRFLEEEGSVVETLEEIGLSDRPPAEYFVFLLTLHRGYLFSKSL